tara:strand:- start:133 stop:261 length:129 start_codon:yes stop_codon:yes gene_type:complete
MAAIRLIVDSTPKNRTARDKANRLNKMRDFAILGNHPTAWRA